MRDATDHSAPGRLAWRCRRGMKELDVVLGRYLASRWPVADAHERALFEQLLDQPDPQLAAWLMGGESPSHPPMQALVDRLRAG